MLRIRSSHKNSKIKFGKLGVAALVLLSGLGITGVVGNLPSSTVHAENWKFISIYSLPANGTNVYARAYGCKTLRNTAFGQVADVKILYTLEGTVTSFPTGEVSAYRPDGPHDPPRVAYSQSSSWWNGNTQLHTMTVSVLLNDFLHGYVGSAHVINVVVPTSLNNC